MTATIEDSPGPPTAVVAAAAWERLRSISPRTRVRIADVDAAGRPRNVYGGTYPLSRPVDPGRPWAVYLADRGGRYRLLALDLDAARGPVQEDLAQLRGWLAQASIPHLVARSGPGGGRHVWAAITGQGAPAALIAQLARALSTRLPTLDPAPLLNPATGCVRPPGAPHRAGGISELIAGDWSVLTDPAATVEQLQLLLAVIGPATLRPTADAAGATVATVVDEEGHCHLPGPRRPLPARSQHALDTALGPDDDPSAVAWTVLLGAARARWRHRDIAALVAASPGLEHLRSARVAPALAHRVARPAAEQAALVARQWAQAVAHVAGAAEDGPTGDDPTFPVRVEAVLAAVRAVQARADVCPGRWARPGGAADRRVLDQACVIALRAVRREVALDIRSLAGATGVSRETCRAALLRLAEDGWLSQTLPSRGPFAAVWALPAPVIDLRENADPGSSTGQVYRGRSHVVPPPADPSLAPLPHPPRAGPGREVARSAWLHRLGSRLSSQAHDVFVRDGLGHDPGRVYGGLVSLGPTDPDTLAARLGYSPARTRALLQVLAGHRLARPGRGGRTWHAGAGRHLVRAATVLGVRGVLAERARRSAAERAVWAWWLSELEWMHTPADQRPRYGRRGRRPGPGQAALPLPMPTGVRERHGAYPRGRDTRADHRQARTALDPGHSGAA